MAAVLIEQKLAQPCLHTRMGGVVATDHAAQSSNRVARRMQRSIVPPLQSGNAIACGLSALRVGPGFLAQLLQPPLKFTTGRRIGQERADDGEPESASTLVMSGSIALVGHRLTPFEASFRGPVFVHAPAINHPLGKIAWHLLRGCLSHYIARPSRPHWLVKVARNFIISINLLGLHASEPNRCKRLSGN